MNKPIVLFLCTANSARSQMAEALLRRRAGDRFEVRSAGLEPNGIHPLTHRVMQEIGISLEGHRSKPLSEFLGKISAHHVIFVCENAERACPRIWPFAIRTACWPFADPAAVEASEDEQLQSFRRVRDAIDARIEDWLAEAPFLESAALADSADRGNA
jgi:arsenate reductase